MKTSDIDPVDHREWTAQEQGLRAARAEGPAPPRTGARARGADTGTGGSGRAGTNAARDYRSVARAIATAPRSLPPPDFAAAAAAGAGAPRPGFEPALARSLLLVLGAAAPVAALAAIGPAWQALRIGLGGGTLGWTAVAAACMGVTWAVGQLRRLRAG